MINLHGHHHKTWGDCCDYLRSSKRLTVPKEPNFHNTQNKRAKCVASSQFNTA